MDFARSGRLIFIVNEQHDTSDRPIAQHALRLAAVSSLRGAQSRLPTEFRRRLTSGRIRSFWLSSALLLRE
jgi:hypothetical protein